MPKAILIGATGLVGKELLTLLEKDIFFDKIEVWTRKPIQSTVPKTTIKIIDFDQLPEMIDIHTVFCSVGSTIKKAKTWESFRKVDYDIPVQIAKNCKQVNVEKLIVISSLGANPESSNKYLKTKGEMENALLQSGIPSLYILRPSILLGNREEFRFGELIGKFVIQLTERLLVGNLRKYRGIKVSTVARAMLILAKGKTTDKAVLESDEIEHIGSLIKQYS